MPTVGACPVHKAPATADKVVAMAALADTLSHPQSDQCRLQHNSSAPQA
jgi:hypothetical protein